jgi:hypothetical protein
MLEEIGEQVGRRGFGGLQAFGLEPARTGPGADEGPRAPGTWEIASRRPPGLLDLLALLDGLGAVRLPSPEEGEREPVGPRFADGVHVIGQRNHEGQTQAPAAHAFADAPAGTELTVVGDLHRQAVGQQPYLDIHRTRGVLHPVGHRLGDGHLHVEGTVAGESRLRGDRP